MSGTIHNLARNAQRRPEYPDTWCVVQCNECLETWTVDTYEFTPPLTTYDVELLLLRELEVHVCPPEPGACGDPACHVLHADPSNPIHPPWYVDSRESQP